MSTKNDFEIDLAVHKLEIEGIDKILDIVKLIVGVGTPACAVLLSQGLSNWWQWVAFGVLFGVVLGAFVELFSLTGDRNEIVSRMKQRHIQEKTRSRSIFAHFFRGKGTA